MRWNVLDRIKYVVQITGGSLSSCKTMYFKEHQYVYMLTSRKEEACVFDLKDDVVLQKIKRDLIGVRMILEIIN